MKIDETFTRAVGMLPDPVRERLDGDTPLDWPALESPLFGTELADAAAAHRRLPGAVEALAHRLIRDVGIVPADVAAGIERQGAASAWINWVTLEADGDGYQIRNDRDGEVRYGVRPEAIAGYTALALELAAIVYKVGGRWKEAGARHRVAPEEERSPLARCAVLMSDQLRSRPEAISRRLTAAGLARTLEFAWNDLDRETRTTLVGVRLSTGRGARAPRRSYLTPARSHLLNAFDLGEIRWLWALAERAAATVGERAARGGPRLEGRAGEPAAVEANRIRFRTDSDRLSPDREADKLAHAATRLRGATRRWIEETYGATSAQGLARLQSRDALGALGAALGPSASRQPVPNWMLKLAEPLLRDTGVQTHAGLRTGSVRLDPQRTATGEYRVEEAGDGAIRTPRSGRADRSGPLGSRIRGRRLLGLRRPRGSGERGRVGARRSGHSGACPLGERTRDPGGGPGDRPCDGRNPARRTFGPGAGPEHARADRKHGGHAPNGRADGAHRSRMAGGSGSSESSRPRGCRADGGGRGNPPPAGSGDRQPDHLALDFRRAGGRPRRWGRTRPASIRGIVGG